MTLIPKYRKEVLYGQLNKELRLVLREFKIQKERGVVEGKLIKDHVHVLMSIPLKCALAQVIAYIEGKNAIGMARTLGRSRNFMGQNFWARGRWVTMTGLDEETIREYIRIQEETDNKLDQLKIFE